MNYEIPVVRAISNDGITRHPVTYDPERGILIPMMLNDTIIYMEIPNNTIKEAITNIFPDGNIKL